MAVKGQKLKGIKPGLGSPSEKTATNLNAGKYFPLCSRAEPYGNPEGFRDTEKIACYPFKPFTFHRSPFTSERGIALMMVLWVLVLLSIIALNYFGSNRWNTAATRNLKEETLAYAMAMSAIRKL
jgi:hypothetical protein